MLSHEHAFRTSGLSKTQPSDIYISVAEIWGRHLAEITPMLLSGRSTNYWMEQASQSRGRQSHMQEQVDQKKKKKVGKMTAGPI